ncbi:LemA family protein [Anaeromyxobacter dehalogenans 2CP-1]|uniref:LemA family protein n=1 Tax=Anaeromyxobacter dehalogenans (strain ATCC BAA-258 / DSM 21875 / 2CP-1) TaxID=455488 RepID=B8J5B5_ANAD2|nr:LemA family protein [Anaeromyxobacter dehalogenans]ACL66777.1 LemA family protein [Anaeromyxobacter dehalogenans 2CP-1]
MAVVLVLLGLVVLVALAAVGIYNGLVTRRNAYKNAYSQIDVQLKRRYDLIPNLVETARGYLKHERETLEAVVAARNGAAAAARAAAANPGDPQAMNALSGAEGALAGVLTRFLAVAEAYPDLKANQNMLALQEELTSTENRIAFARQAYNDAVMAYNNARETFPGVLLAGGFPPATSFELQGAAEREPVRVQF